MGSTNTALTVPSRDIDVPGDGNCLFNAFSRAITGSIEQQSDIRAAIVNHMPNIEGYLARGWFPRIYQTAREYIAGERMDRNHTWGTVVEIVTIADLLRTKVYSYNETQQGWVCYSSPSSTDPNTPAIYLKFVNGNHFRVVTSIQ